jgi:hypothetical protein
MIIMDISISMDILYMNKPLILVSVISVIIFFSGTTSVFAAQLNWDARTLDSAFIPKFTFQRTVAIEYADGGVIADQLKGKQIVTQFSSDSSTKGISELIGKINEDSEKNGIDVQISDIQVVYLAELVGRQTAATIDYKVTVTPRITGFLIREYKEGSPALFDVSWRGIKVEGPVTLSDGMQQIEINRPISFLQNEFPAVYEQLVGTDAEKLLSIDIIDATGVNQLQILKWHSLFDPTAIVAETKQYGFKGDVVTTFSMGESTIFTPIKEKESETTFVTDEKYVVRTLEAADSANIFIPGYADADVLNNIEIIKTSPTASEEPGTGAFPIFIIYGMAGLAAVGACVFFWWSGKKAKRDLALGQTGIDPSLLRGSETSSAAGGYKTNRAEGHLINDVTYDQTKSVYTDKNN